MAAAVPIGDPQPSQLYVDAARLHEALEWFAFDAPSYDPVPVLCLDGELVLADGHTRAFLAVLAGAEELRVVREPDRAELNLALYRQCVEWCREESVTAVADLAGRVVSPETFRERWIGRCRASALSEAE